MDLKQKLTIIYTTLNRIEIKGDANMEYMYGVFLTLRDLIAELENPKTELQDN